MGKYIKKFDTHSDYEDFTETEDYIEPNVSYCVDNTEVHYNPDVKRIVATINVTRTDRAIYILRSGRENLFDEIYIDGVKNSVVSSYTFDTTGEHTVEYVLKSKTELGDNVFNGSGIKSIILLDSITSIGDNAFTTCYSLTDIHLPNNITTIGSEVFMACINLTDVTIPSTITSIGDDAFSQCSSLTSITIEATNPPTLGTGVFTGSNYPIYVPSTSVETYKAASGWSTYTSRIQPIPTT